MVRVWINQSYSSFNKILIQTLFWSHKKTILPSISLWSLWDMNFKVKVNLEISLTWNYHFAPSAVKIDEKWRLQNGVFTHSHFGYTHFINMLCLNSPTLSTIEHNLSYKFFPLTLGILWSYNIPNVLLHFFHLSLILLLTSSSTSQFLWIIDSKYQKIVLFGISWPLRRTTPLSLFPLLLNLHFMYSLLVLLNQKYLDFTTSRWISILTFFFLMTLGVRTSLRTDVAQ